MIDKTRQTSDNLGSELKDLSRQLLNLNRLGSEENRVWNILGIELKKIWYME